MHKIHTVKPKQRVTRILLYVLRPPRYEFGSALYVGWGAACLTIIGGAFLCCHCSSDGQNKAPRYPPSRSAGQPGKDYV